MDGKMVGLKRDTNIIRKIYNNEISKQWKETIKNLAVAKSLSKT